MLRGWRLKTSTGYSLSVNKSYPSGNPFRVANMRPMGWLISVQIPEATYRPLYATVASSYEQARLQAFNRCSLTSETLRLERILTEPEAKQLGLVRSNSTPPEHSLRRLLRRAKRIAVC